MRNIFKLIATLGLSLATAVSADEIDINLWDESAYIGYAHQFPIKEHFAANASGSILWNTDDNQVLSLGLTGSKPFDEYIPPTIFSLGLKGFYAHFDGFDALAIALGGGARIAMPIDFPIYISGEVYFAPAITTYQDSENFLFYTTALEYGVTERGSIYFGYRKVTSELDTSDRSDNVVIDSSFMAGIRFLF